MRASLCFRFSGVETEAIKMVDRRREEKSFVSQKGYQSMTEERSGLEDKNEGKRSQREVSLIQEQNLDNREIISSFRAQ